MKLLACILLAGFAVAQAQTQPQMQTQPQISERPGNPAVVQAHLVREVRHELVTLPYYTIFDDLSYKVEGRTVTLMGAVTNPTLKDDAGRVVKNVEGVEDVKNEIEVLPLSPNDDRIRRQTATAVFSRPGLQKYSLSAMPSIHFIVKNGHVTLKGVVDNDMDKQLAYTAALGVSGVFSVNNELQVGNSQ